MAGLSTVTENYFVFAGVNIPDHDALFATLSSQLRQKVTPHVATLQLRNCATIRSTVEHLVLQFMSRKDGNMSLEVMINLYAGLKENCVFMSLIVKQYRHKCSFVDIRVYSGYVKSLPLVFVFGVATAVCALHRSLPYHVSSKLCNEVFHSEPSITYLNQVIDKVLLTSKCPFHLDDRTFKLLTDIFLFYDFSVHGFIQHFKYCMIEHFFNSNSKVLCCPIADMPQNIKSLSEEQLEELRQLSSFRQYVDTLPKKEKAPLLLDNSHFKVVLQKLMVELYEYVQNFHTFLRCLHVLTSSLPKAPLGKHVCIAIVLRKDEIKFVLLTCYGTKIILQWLKEGKLVINKISQLGPMDLSTNSRCGPPDILGVVYIVLLIACLCFQLREVYSMAVASNVSEASQFKECFQLLGFQSREELLDKIEKVLSILQSAMKEKSGKCPLLKEVEQKLSEYHTKIAELGMKTAEQTLKSPTKIDIGENINRHQLKEKLLELSRKQRPLSAYEETRKSLLDYLAGSVFPQFLVPPVAVPFHEVLFFSNMARVKRHIVGTPRAAVHMALNNPCYYLQCDCCRLDKSSSVSSTLPDICIVYKLHLECGRLINMYDWLQAFLAIVSPSESGEEQREVPPQMQYPLIQPCYFTSTAFKLENK
ncbi:hypothetical protein ANN_16950 [Periplaneta americana]|uniref:Origin recognition complex subunit 3 n=1 Tax=Periplaneta americana TaxID=6978 RepID=A0ABQ8SSC4_PERAM|nr:hypothetical protein ANN_16950 [Periplaneta americana]